MFTDGRTALAAPNVPQRLVALTDVTPARRITNITIQAPASNSASVFVGGATVVSTPAGSTTGVELAPGATESFSATDAADIYFAGAAGDVLRFRAKAL